MNDLISVIIPVYNVENYLIDCVVSVIKQTYRNIEIVIVDDGSTDTSSSICDRFAKKFDNIKVIHKPNGGLSDARNVGIENSCGKYLFFLDSDDIIQSDCLAELYEALINNKADIAVTNLCSLYIENQKVITKFPNYKFKNCFNNIEALESMLYLECFTWSACGKLFNRKLFEKIRFPKNRLWEDMACIPIIVGLAEKIVLIRECKYLYRVRQGSITRNNVDYKLLNDYLKSAKEIYIYLDNCFPKARHSAEVLLTAISIDVVLKLWNNRIADNDDLLRSAKDIIKKHRKSIIKNCRCKNSLRLKCFMSLFGFKILVYTNQVYKSIVKFVNYVKFFIR